MAATPPRMHGSTHANGGTDPIPGLGDGGGSSDPDALHFGTNVGVEKYVEIFTESTAVGGSGITLRTEDSGLGVVLSATNNAAGPSAHAQLQVGEPHYGDGVSTRGFIGVAVDVSPLGSLRLHNIPITDPGWAEAVWNDGGTLVMSGSTAGGGTAGPPGPTGPTGPTGPAGPNVVNDTTASPLVGLLKANGTDVDVAVANTDYVTPANLTTQLGNKVDRDAVAAATTRLVAVKLAAGDTQPAFRILGNGKHEWGQGGTSAPDTNLYRNGPNSLKTDNQFQTGEEMVARQGQSAQISFGERYAGGPPAIFLGNAFDTILFRGSAETLVASGSSTRTVFAVGGTPPGTTSGVNVIWINNGGAPGAQSGGGFLYSLNGALRWRGPTTDTQIAPA